MYQSVVQGYVFAITRVSAKCSSRLKWWGMGGGLLGVIIVVVVLRHTQWTGTVVH